MTVPVLMSPELREARERLRRVPISTVSDLFTLDPDEIADGYSSGREGFPCGDNLTRAQFHGWRNGAMDSHRMEPDAYSIALIADIRSRGIRLMDLDAVHRKQFEWLKSIGIA